ncbi:DUF2062 domain-containing protein [Phyllobacterium phragmitis]|uniref:DUF2062 domain-containing protein n=1 Tax=Phyllobacterium phragmitis TaxID=2670329 RepID=A0A2S9IZC0_9HYPH|nr:DUF2062 domain-containing protein [Phyllobacterium phragmitis]PRD45848.1 DUF2062 domain-containing protein [Phyllobacterium phragmitis]
MLFRRRKPVSPWERLRTYLWPRRSFSRSLRYMGKRIMRITASPHAIAAGLAVGVFSAFTPFFGFHIIIAIVLAYIFAGNVAAAALGTTVANPLTVPVIWGATFEFGRFMLTGDFSSAHPPVHLGRMLEHFNFHDIWGPVLKPMLFGSTVLGLFFALIVYVVTRWAIGAFHRKRRERLAARANDNSDIGALKSEAFGA